METKKVCNNHLKGMWAGLDESGFPHDCSSTVSSDLTDYFTNNKKISR